MQIFQYFTLLTMDESRSLGAKMIYDFQQKIEGMEDINISRSQILTLIMMFHWDDLEFIEKVNDLTYSRKVQLKSKMNKN